MYNQHGYYRFRPLTGIKVMYDYGRDRDDGIYWAAFPSPCGD
ncbi:hypothetical protein [Megasphaera hexanoica]